MAITGDDQGVELQFVFQVGEDSGQCQPAGAGEAVGAVGRSETQDACRAVIIDLEVERHGNMMHHLLRRARKKQALPLRAQGQDDNTF